MKTSLSLLVVTALAAFFAIILNAAFAATLLFGLGLYGLVYGDYSRVRVARLSLSRDSGPPERTERLSLAA